MNLEPLETRHPEISINIKLEENESWKRNQTAAQKLGKKSEKYEKC